MRNRLTIELQCQQNRHHLSKVRLVGKKGLAAVAVLLVVVVVVAIFISVAAFAANVHTGTGSILENTVAITFRLVSRLFCVLFVTFSNAKVSTRERPLIWLNLTANDLANFEDSVEITTSIRRRMKRKRKRSSLDLIVALVVAITNVLLCFPSNGLNSKEQENVTLDLCRNYVIEDTLV